MEGILFPDYLKSVFEATLHFQVAPAVSLWLTEMQYKTPSGGCATTHTLCQV